MDSEPETCLIGQFGTLGTGMHSQHLLTDFVLLIYDMAGSRCCCMHPHGVERNGHDADCRLSHAMSAYASLGNAQTTYKALTDLPH